MDFYIKRGSLLEKTEMAITTTKTDRIEKGGCVMYKKTVVVFVLMLCFCFITSSVSVAFAQTTQQQQTNELLERQIKALKKQTQQQSALILKHEKLAAAQAAEMALARREQEKLAATQAQAAAETKTIIMIAAGVIILCAVIIIFVMVIILSRRRNASTNAKHDEQQTKKGVLIDPTSEKLKKIASDTGATEIRFDLPLKKEGAIFECVAVIINNALKVRFLKDPKKNLVGWDNRRSYAAKNLLQFAK